tara:strand:+ start:626 stop:850 length:225 start_codon:yes stop_codon:yes gene_type:complete
MKKLIITKENPNGIIVDMTADEIKEREADVIRLEEKNKQYIQKQNEADTKKASAKKKLQDLGLTTDEIKEAFGI